MDTTILQKIMTVIPINDDIRLKVNDLIKEEWAGPMIATKGNVINTSKIPGFIVVDGNEMLGAITYNIENGKCEITTLNSLCTNKGIGSALINAVIDEAKRNNCKKVWLITTNDNTHAIRYYQKYGFSLAAVHINAVNKSRELKPSIPMLGIDDILILHEFEFEITL